MFEQALRRLAPATLAPQGKGPVHYITLHHITSHYITLHYILHPKWTCLFGNRGNLNELFPQNIDRRTFQEIVNILVKEKCEKIPRNFCTLIPI